MAESRQHSHRRLLSIAAVLIAIPAVSLSGQVNPERTKFEAASIKPSNFVPGNRIGVTGGPGSNDPGRVTIMNYVLSDLITTAYGVHFYQLSGPDWLTVNYGSEAPRFDIVAKVPEGATKEEFQLMLQNLLVERFKVAARRETKDIPVYNLVAAKGGRRLTPAVKAPATAEGAPAQHPGPRTFDKDGFPVLAPGEGSLNFNKTGGARLQAPNLSMAKLVTLLSAQGHLGRPVNDATGLSGDFSFVLTWQLNEVSAANVNSLPTIFDALQQQLGLKLEAAKGPADVLVIDHIEKAPTEN